MATKKKVPKERIIETDFKAPEIPKRDTTQQTRTDIIPTTPREQAAFEQEQAAIRETEQRQKAALYEPNPDKPFNFGQIQDQAPVVQDEIMPTPNAPKGTPKYVGDERVTAAEYKNQLEIAKILSEGGKKAQTAEERLRFTEALNSIGQVNPSVLAGLEEAGIDYGQAITAGTIGNIGGIATSVGGVVGAGLLGAKTGGTAGTILGPLGTLSGAVGGALLGVAIGVIRNIEQQKKGEIRAAVDVLSSARTNMRQLATLASRDPGNAPIYIKQYNDQLTQLHRAHGQIKIETQGNLNSYVEDGTDILSDFELFLREGGTADIYKQRLLAALNSGVPLDFLPGELANE